MGDHAPATTGIEDTPARRRAGDELVEQFAEVRLDVREPVLRVCSGCRVVTRPDDSFVIHALRLADAEPRRRPRSNRR
jgi:hypothetical protein